MNVVDEVDVLENIDVEEVNYIDDENVEDDADAKNSSDEVDDVINDCVCPDEVLLLEDVVVEAGDLSDVV